MRQIQIVLCQTLYSGNVGSSARAMTLMGYENLVLCAPQCDYLSQEAYQLATFATETLEKAVIVNSLENFIQPVDFVIGLSVRTRDLGPPACSLPDLKEFLPDNSRRIVFLFGSESAGLTNSELAHAHLQCSIPTFHPRFSSLNLSHAVGIVCYHFALLGRGESTFNHDSLEAKQDHEQVLLGAFEGFLDEIVIKANRSGFCERTSVERTQRRLKLLLNQAIKSAEDRDFLFGFLKALSRN